MLDALCILPADLKSSIKNIEDENKCVNHLNITFSIFEFVTFSEQKIALYRRFLFCPVCLQVAYYRQKSKDGKQACFGSRCHLPNCSELNSSSKKHVTNDLLIDKNEAPNINNTIGQKIIPKQIVDVKDSSKKSLKGNSKEGIHIDFSLKGEASLGEVKVDKKVNKSTSQAKNEKTIKEEVSSSIKKNLASLLKSLLMDSSISASNVWVYTSETHKWRAKNLFVKFSDVELLENSPPRMYWGTIKSADKQLLWLNVAGVKNVAIPIKAFQQQLLDHYSIAKNDDFLGANIILFAKCFASKDGTRKFLQLWSNDLHYMHLSFISK